MDDESSRHFNPQVSEKYVSDSRDWREIQTVLGRKRLDDLKKGSWAGFAIERFLPTTVCISRQSLESDTYFSLTWGLK